MEAAMLRALALAAALVVVGCAAQPQPDAVRPEERRAAPGDTLLLTIRVNADRDESAARSVLHARANQICGGSYTMLAEGSRRSAGYNLSSGQIEEQPEVYGRVECE